MQEVMRRGAVAHSEDVKSEHPLARELCDHRRHVALATGWFPDVIERSMPSAGSTWRKRARDAHNGVGK